MVCQVSRSCGVVCCRQGTFRKVNFSGRKDWVEIQSDRGCQTLPALFMSRSQREEGTLLQGDTNLLLSSKQAFAHGLTPE